MARQAFWIALLPLAAHAFALQTFGRVPGLGGRPVQHDKMTARGSILGLERKRSNHRAVAAAATGAAAPQAQLKLPSQIDWEERGSRAGAGGPRSRDNGEASRLRGAERHSRRIQR